jgi:acetolactate synthase-1/2/3 large subunit
MGYGLPAGLAAKLRYPQRMVVVFSGDGDFQMTMQEFVTAVQESAAIVVVVVNNGVHGTIRMHQERHYPDRPVATDIVNPDFAAFARACGGHGETVATTEDFAAAFERCVASAKPAIIDLAFDPEASTPARTLSEIRGTGRR